MSRDAPLVAAAAASSDLVAAEETLAGIMADWADMGDMAEMLAMAAVTVEDLGTEEEGEMEAGVEMAGDAGVEAAEAAAAGLE